MFNRLKSVLRRSREKQTLRVEPQGVELELRAGQTLLEAMLARRIVYPHNCKVGTCGSCRSILQAGRVKARADFAYALSKAELDAGLILACQAIALDEKTVIEQPDPSENLPAPREYSARITQRKALTSDIARVTMSLDAPLDYVAGQYASIRAPGMANARHYALADAPRRGGRQKISFFVRHIPGGAFTHPLFQGQLDGQSLALNAPHGDFHLRRGAAPMVLVAEDTGLAPILSMLDDARMRRIRRRVTLLFGTRHAHELYLLERLDDLQQSWPAPFDFIPVVSTGPIPSARTVQRGMALELLGTPSVSLPWHETEVYLCGRPAMVDAGIAKVTQLGVAPNAIHCQRMTE